VDRAGRITVDVRTPDVDLARVLRTDVDRLVSRLEQNGYRTEMWVPGDRVPSVAESRESGTGYSGNPDRKGNQEDGRFGPGQDPRQQQERRSQQAWMNYFDDNLNDNTVSDRRNQ